MNETPEVSLEEQRLRLRGELEVHRTVLAEQLAADRAPPGTFPRSATMQWLIQQPALAVVVVKWLLQRRRVSLALAAGFVAWHWSRKKGRAPVREGAPAG